MPIHSLATYLSSDAATPILIAFISLACVVVFKRWSNGRKNTWERDWGGKMILIVAEPSSTTFELLHSLSHLPHPPQILYLPPIPSPLPQSLLTILHTIRLSASSSGTSTGELSCEPLPNTPEAVRDFIRKWIVPVPGTGEGGRRVDAIVWGDGWEVERPLSMFAQGSTTSSSTPEHKKHKINFADFSSVSWTSEQCQFHFITAILPCLLKQPMERSIRLINLVSPFYSAAIPFLPTLNSASTTPTILKTNPSESPVVASGKSSLRSILLFSHLQRVLDALASVEQVKIGAVPVPNEEAAAATEMTTPTASKEIRGDEEGMKRRKGNTDPKDSEVKPVKTISVQSNILALTAVIGLHRSGVVQGLIGARRDTHGSLFGLILYILFFPLIYIFTPSTNACIQSTLHALSAPVIYAKSDEKDHKGESKVGPPHREEKGVSGGDLIRDCQSIKLPLLSDRINLFGQQVWEELENQVEQGVKDCITRETKRKESTVPTEPASTESKAPADASSGSETDEWERLEKREFDTDQTQ